MGDEVSFFDISGEVILVIQRLSQRSAGQKKETNRTDGTMHIARNVVFFDSLVDENV